MKPVIRVDDFIGTKPNEFNKHNLENFKLFNKVFEKHQLSYTLGVIPKYFTDEHLEWFKTSEADRIDIALHGIEHNENFVNEFREFETENDIYEKIMKAKIRLEEANAAPITKYIPPHNVINMNTYLALKRAGFDTLMCGPGTDTDILRLIKEEDSMLVLYSAHPIWYGRSDEMMDRDNSIELIGRDIQMGHLNRCMTLHWTWECNIGFESIDRLLERTKGFF
jgi:hypothetical protein